MLLEKEIFVIPRFSIKILSRFHLQKYFNLVPTAQRFEDVLGILREGCISPFELMIKSLNDSNLKYWAHRNKLYKEETKNLM